jgi:hypothetical protein
MKRKIYIVFFVALIAAVSSGLAVGQERGQYLAGSRGLNTADQPAPGFTYANLFFVYPTSRFKDRDGNRVPIDFNLNLVGDLNVLAYTPKKKFLGATYSASVAIPFVTSAVTIPRIGADISGGGIGDIYVEPISLGWAMKKGKVRAAYGFYAPTGVDSTTSDYWGHQITFGGSYNPGKTRLWQINASSAWEIHHKKGHEDITVGNNVTFEYGVGKTFVKNGGKHLYQLGVVGYSGFQLTNDTGTAVPLLSRGVKDRVHAIGPEFGLILPAKKLNLLVRVLPEYEAHGRTQGLTFVFSLGKTFAPGQ